MVLAMTVTLDQALGVLRANKEQLRAKGVLHAAVFGSIARGDAGPDSDVDVLLEMDPGMRIDLFGYASLCEDIKGMFPSRVDVANARMLRPLLRDSILHDRIDAF
jgi:predicted nucleotidyltransferase